jgi:hypothetical protein
VRAEISGWFQPWITPSIFENTGNDSIVDEYTLGTYQNNKTTIGIMQNHWDTVCLHSGLAVHDALTFLEHSGSQKMTLRLWLLLI